MPAIFSPCDRLSDDPSKGRSEPGLGGKSVRDRSVGAIPNASPSHPVWIVPEAVGVKRAKVCILLAEEDGRYLSLLQHTLEHEGYDVIAARGEAAIEDRIFRDGPDLVLIGSIGRASVCETCRQIRDFSPVPVIVLVDGPGTPDKATVLDAGADDCMTKPFSASELVARVRAALRGRELSTRGKNVSSFQVGDLLVDLARQRVFVGDQEVQLTPTEYRLLYELVANAGRVLVPDYLLTQVWGPEYEGESHLVWQAVHRLRRKIEEDPESPQLIQTRPGIGYILDVTE